MTDERNPSNDVRAWSPLVETFRAALMAEHSDDWDMNTVAEAAYICAAALGAAGFVVLRVPEGTAQHGDELELDRERCSLPAHCMAWFDPRLDHVAECKPAFLMRVRRPVEVNND